MRRFTVERIGPEDVLWTFTVYINGNIVKAVVDSTSYITLVERPEEVKSLRESIEEDYRFEGRFYGTVCATCGQEWRIPSYMYEGDPLCYRCRAELFPDLLKYECDECPNTLEAPVIFTAHAFCDPCRQDAAAAFAKDRAVDHAIKWEQGEKDA